jgi:transposase InsO family protein
MAMARYLVEAHLREGRPVAELAAQHGLHRSWIYKLLARYRAEGEQGLEPRSRRPKHSPSKTSGPWIAEILALRKELRADGLDAGAETIHAHLCRGHKSDIPSPSTIWRVLKAEGLVTPQPHKRPRSSYVRFCAQLPNELWQSDITCFGEVEIMGVIDDHSRLCVAARAFEQVKVADVVATFYEGAMRYGLPASLLSDNGAVYTAGPRNGRCAIESELLALGILYKHSRPYHPQTCGKIERFHQTLKKHLAVQTPARSLAELQAQIDRFAAYYNEVRPHRGIARRTPAEVFAARMKAAPQSNGHPPARHYRVRHDKVDGSGTVTLRYKSRLYHVGLGRAHKGRRVLVLIADRDVRVLTVEGEILRQLELDPSRDYQPLRGRLMSPMS